MPGGHDPHINNVVEDVEPTYEHWQPRRARVMQARERILDACDVETFFVCSDVEEGKRLGLS